MEGWIKLHRDIQSHWIYTEKRIYSRYEAWIDILLRVNHSDNKISHNGLPELVKRGSTIWSMGDMEHRWSWSNRKVKRFLDCLASDGMVVVKSTTKKTYLTVVNYDKYQGSGGEEAPPTHHQRTLDAFQKHTNKNEKNVKKEKISSRQSKSYAEDSSPYRMAVYLHGEIMNFAASISKDHLVRDADMQKWADTCRKILELDKREPREVYKVIQWATKDAFWKLNMLSPDSLRRNYVKLALLADSQSTSGRKGALGGSQNANDRYFDKNKREAEKIKEAIERERVGDQVVILENKQLL